MKTNPSKRHRDRLNVELDHLTTLLPFSEEVRGRLDKLSVLRLSVGYLKVKNYFHAPLQKRSTPSISANGMNGHSVSLDGVSFSEGELLLKALNGFVLVVTTDGTVFYTSSTIQDFLGFHQSDVVHQSVYNLIHMDDREVFRCQLHFSFNPGENDSDTRAESRDSTCVLLPQYLPPENSSFLERSFCCRLRCLLDNTSGFLALNFNGRLKYLHMQGNTGADGRIAPPQLALFAIATPLDPPSVMEIRTKTLIFQTKHRMDFAPLGIDTRGKLVLGYSEIELVTPGSGYQFIHAADMMYCADNHLKMIKTGDSGFTFFRLLTKTGHWLWVQASARIVFKAGRPDFIIARQKALPNEEGEEHLAQRRQQLPFNLATGEGVLYDSWMDAWSSPGPQESSASGITQPATEAALDPASLLGSLHRQDHSVYTVPRKPSPQLPSSLEQAFLDSHALLSVPGQTQASQKRPVTGDLTTDAMIESLEQILGDIGDGRIEGLEVEETELRDWENTLVRMNNEREDVSNELNHILANDVFSYVEEALRRETGGLVQGSDQTGVHASENNSSIPGPHHASVYSNNEQQATDLKSGISQQTQFGDILGGVGFSTGLKDASEVMSHRVTHTQMPTKCENTHGNTWRLWPSSSSSNHCGNQMISSQSCHADHSDTTQQPWFSPFQNTINIHSIPKYALAATDHSVQNPLNHTHAVPQLQNPSALQQQQLPTTLHHHTLTRHSNTPGSLNSTALSHHLQTQRLSSSCMYDKRDSRMPNTTAVAVRQNWPLRGSMHTARTAPSATFTLSHPDLAVGGHDPSNPHIAACTDVGSISLVHVNGDSAGLGTTRSDYPPENGSLQSSFYCWNGNAQVKSDSDF
uniref:Aryl hydrocarbon receptor 2 n=1 Tax=Mola mola TaxID=94237 RepID=A0A3Q4B1K3_MOLML